MWLTVAEGLLIPFFGTSLGAFFVVFTKKNIDKKTQHLLNQFAGGVMMAASIWSLLLPAIEQSSHFGRLAFFPALVGFWLGIIFLAWLGKHIPAICIKEGSGIRMEGFHQLLLLIFAIVLHNIPEGMAVGAVYADWMLASEKASVMGAFILSIGIAVQNIPEGAIVSMPLRAGGVKWGKACLMGVLSGVVEPIAGFITICLSRIILPVMPYLLGFAAGAMIYVVVEELVPCARENEKSEMGTFLFAVGFSVMMILDVTLG